MFPKRSGCNIGVGGFGYSRSAMIDGAHSVFEACKTKYGVRTGNQMSARPIPISPRKILHHGRILAIGDSAGFASPISGEGMSYAFQSARFAADAIELAQKDNGDKDPLKIYDRWCHDSIMRDMRAAALISPPLHWVLGVIDIRKFISNVDHSPEVLDSCQRIAVGDTDWRSLLLVGIKKFPELFFSSLN
jgi:flavin-dependent dehydrogenase